MSMQEVLDNPSRRVFHIGPECYVIFGGTDTKDKDFFIRFGNYPAIPAIVLQKTSAFACTATPLGDIFFELMHSAEQARPVFMGLPPIIRKYKVLFEYSTIQALKYESVASEKPEQGVYIHYTGSEELTVRYNNKPFFSLSGRAKQDRHYQTVVDNAYNAARKMRVALGSKQFAEYGFYMLDSSIYAYNKQSALAIDPDPNFVIAHTAHGLDPKIVQSAYLTNARSLSLHRLLMHAQAHQLKGAILVAQSEDVNLVQRVCNFVGYPFKHTVSPQYQKVLFEGLTIDMAQSPKVIKIAGTHNLKININIDKKRWKVTSGSDSSGDMLYDGLRYGWDLSLTYTWGELRSKFLPQSFNVDTHNIASSEREFLMNGLRMIDSTSQRLLKNALRKLKALQKKCAKRSSRFFMFALVNINQIAALALESRSKVAGSYALLKKAVSIFKSTYNAVRSSSPRSHSGVSIFPSMSALIVHTDGGIRCLIDYQWNKDLPSVLRDDKLCHEVAGFVSTGDADSYADELRRLLALFDSLEGKYRASKGGAQLDDARTGAGADGDGQSAVGSGRGRSGRKGRPLRSFGIVGAVLLVLIAALFGLDFFGVLNVGDVIGVGSRATDNTSGRFSDGATDDTTTQQDSDGGQRTDENNQLQEQRNDGNATTTDSSALSADNDIDIDVLRSAVTDGTNLNSAWLTLSTPFGAVNITVGEIIATTNLIAINSGFRTLGDDSGQGPDPDLIYPDGILRLPPDTAQYNIVLNDTMWGVAENLIVEQVKDHIAILTTINRQLDAGADESLVATAMVAIEEIIALSYCADVIAIATSLLNRL